MRKKDIKITILTLLAVIGGIASASLVLAAEITPQNVVEFVNFERKKVGLEPLLENELLSRSAENKAQDMISKDYFAHNSPEGVTPWDWIEKEGYDYKFAGENLAINFKSAEKQNEAFMESATHRKNILGEQFNEIGVAVASRTVNGKKTIVTVQQFGNRGVEIVLPEKKVDGAQSKELLSEVKRSVFFDSGIVFASGSSAQGGASGISFFKNALVISSFALVVVVILQILGRFYAMGNFIGKKGTALHTISPEEYERMFRGLPFDFEKIQIIYLDQMKQRE